MSVEKGQLLWNQIKDALECRSYFLFGDSKQLKNTAVDGAASIFLNKKTLYLVPEGLKENLSTVLDGLAVVN